MTRGRSEDEWFAKHERTLIEDLKRERKRREEKVAAALKEEEGKRLKELHWMKCPKCGSDLVEETLQEKAQIDRCTRCGGMYFDRGELEDALFKPLEKRKTFRIALLHLILPSAKSKEFDREKMLKAYAKDKEHRAGEVKAWLSTPEGKKQKDLHWMRCSKCGSQMIEKDVSHNLMLDDCTLCRGIFLDYGELEDISALDQAARNEIRDRILSNAIPG